MRTEDNEINDGKDFRDSKCSFSSRDRLGIARFRILLYTSSFIFVEEM